MVFIIDNEYVNKFGLLNAHKLGGVDENCMLYTYTLSCLLGHHQPLYH